MIFLERIKYENRKQYIEMKSGFEFTEEDEQSKQFSLVQKVLKKTFMWNMGPGIKAMTPKESKEWHETHAYYDKDGGFHICTDPVEYDGVNKIKPNIKI